MPETMPIVDVAIAILEGRGIPCICGWSFGSAGPYQILEARDEGR